MHNDMSYISIIPTIEGSDCLSPKDATHGYHKDR